MFAVKRFVVRVLVYSHACQHVVGRTCDGERAPLYVGHESIALHRRRGSRCAYHNFAKLYLCRRKFDCPHLARNGNGDLCVFITYKGNLCDEIPGDIRRDAEHTGFICNRTRDIVRVAVQHHIDIVEGSIVVPSHFTGNLTSIDRERFTSTIAHR